MTTAEQTTLEFKLLNPKTDSGFIQAIEFNYEELKAGLTKALENFQGIVYSDKTIQEAKKDKAKLNKLIENMENERKRVKTLCMQAYEPFELKVKELVKIAEEPKNAIDAQVKEFETRKKTEKQDEIYEFYRANIGDLIDLLPWEKIFVPSWLNSTTTMASIQKEINLKICKVTTDLQAIKDLKSEWELTLLDTYLKTFDISGALREKTRLEERQAALQGRQKAQSEREAVEKKPTITAPPPVQQTLRVEQPQQQETEAEKVFVRRFQVSGTAEQLVALGQYMKDNNITYTGI